MSMNYRKLFSRKQTPQSQAIPGSNQVPNSAGGFAWAVDDWTRLERFLILGTEGGSYYASERTLTRENAEAVERCIVADGVRVVERIVAISDAGRAPKNDPAHLRAGDGGEARRLRDAPRGTRGAAEGLPHRHAPHALRRLRAGVRRLGPRHAEARCSAGSTTSRSTVARVPGS